VAALTSLLTSPLLPKDYTSARAESIEIGPDWRVSEREAVRIAQREGIVDVNRVTCRA
jgi:hypothetical protein